MVKAEKKIKSPENPEEIRKPNKFPENEIMVSYLINKPSILSRNIKKLMKSEDLRRRAMNGEKSKSITSELLVKMLMSMMEYPKHDWPSAFGHKRLCYRK